MMRTNFWIIPLTAGVLVGNSPPTASGGGVTQPAIGQCVSPWSERVADVPRRLSQEWVVGISEAMLLLNLRMPGSECARQSVVTMLDPNRQLDIARLIIQVARSDPDPTVRLLAYQQLSRARSGSPELSRFLSDLPSNLPLQQGNPEVVVVLGSLASVDESPAAGPEVLVRVFADQCRGTPLLSAPLRTDAAKSFEFALRRPDGTTRLCIAGIAGARRGEAMIEATNSRVESRMLRSDTVRLSIAP